MNVSVDGGGETDNFISLDLAINRSLKERQF